jgi:hypothetical protein
MNFLQHSCKNLDTFHRLVKDNALKSLAVDLVSPLLNLHEIGEVFGSLDCSLEIPFA